jgi:hypothetical protein
LRETGNNIKNIFSSDDYGNTWHSYNFYDNWKDIAVSDQGLQAVINNDNLYYNYFIDYNENYLKVKDSKIIDIDAGYNSNLIITDDLVKIDDVRSSTILDYIKESGDQTLTPDTSPVIIQDSWFNLSNGVSPNGVYLYLKDYNEKPSYISTADSFTISFITGRKFWLSGWEEEVYQAGEISGNLNTMSGIISGTFKDIYDYEFISPDFEGLEPYWGNIPTAVLITGLGALTQSGIPNPGFNFQIKWNQNRWNVYYNYNTVIYYSTENTLYPWEVKFWSGLTPGPNGTFKQINPYIYFNTGYTGGNFGTIRKYTSPIPYGQTIGCSGYIFDE